MIELDDTPEPLVTVIMPIRNEEKFIKESLGAVMRQDYPHDRLEILIADGMSTDNTRDIVEHMAAEAADMPVIVMDNHGKIVSTGLNAALRRAKGDIIIRIDGHTVIDSDYVYQCVRKIQQTSADNVGGCMNAVGQGILGQAIALATSSVFGVGGARFHYSKQEEWVDTVYMGAWRREVFDRIGSFDEELIRNQDDEFSYRIRANGGKILLDPSIRSRYFNRSNLSSLARQYFQYGFYKVRVMQKHPAQMRPRQFVPPVFVATIIIGLLFAPFSELAFFLWMLAMGLYLLANLCSSLMTACKSGWRSFLLLPITFTILHFSYGSGFLGGMVRFRNRWNDSK